SLDALDHRCQRHRASSPTLPRDASPVREVRLPMQDPEPLRMRFFSPAMVVTAISLSLAGAPAFADQTTPPPPPDESILGTVDVTGAAAAALPKLAVMPIVTTGEADTTLQL